MATWLCASEDELDIVREATMNDSAEEDHLDLPLPSIPLCPILECAELSRASWVNLEMVLVNDNEVAMVEGIYRNTHPQDCIDENPLGTEDVGVVISESLIHTRWIPLMGSPSAGGH
jgi:hypothetical protein